MRSLLVALTLSFGFLLTASPAFAGERQHTSGGRAGYTKAFDHKPKEGEKAICPVSKETFIVDKDTKTAQYKGKWYAFCCDDCPADFEKVKKKL